MGAITNGVSAIKLGAIATDGGMGTTLSQLGYTSLGTAKLNTEDGNTVDLNVEETDDPIYSKTRAGKMSVNFTIADPDEQTLVTFWGGSYDATKKEYTPPAVISSKELSLQVISEEGLSFNFPRASVTAKFTTDLGKDSFLGLEVTAQILKPTKTGVRPFFTKRI